MYPEFKNKVVLITGASSGIGYATALAFAKEGAKLFIADIQDEQGRQIASEIQNLGTECTYIHCDVSKTKEVEHMVTEVVKHHGRIDIAYNNAGIEGEVAPLGDSTEKNFDNVIGINLKGVWACMKYEIPQMLKQKGGVIVNCSSIAGIVGSAGISIYDASKHGVIGLTKTAALEYAGQNIRINAVCPAGVKTPMLERFIHGNPEVEKQMDAMHPIGRAANPGEIADAVLYLSSDRASFITGHEMLVDGGYTAQ